MEEEGKKEDKKKEDKQMPSPAAKALPPPPLSKDLQSPQSPKQSPEFPKGTLTCFLLYHIFSNLLGIVMCACLILNLF